MDPSRALELVRDRDGTPAEALTSAPRRTRHTGAFAPPHLQGSRTINAKTSTKAAGTPSKNPAASTASSLPPFIERGAESQAGTSPQTATEPARFATPSKGVRGRFVPGNTEAAESCHKLASHDSFATPSKANLRRSSRPRPNRSSRSGATSSSGLTQPPDVRSSQNFDKQDLSRFSFKSITAQVSSSHGETDEPTPPTPDAAEVTTIEAAAAEVAISDAKSLSFGGDVGEGFTNDGDATNSPQGSPPGTYRSDEGFSDIAQSQPLRGTQESLASEHDEGEGRYDEEGKYSEDEDIFRNPLSPTPQEAGVERQAHRTMSSGAGSQMDSGSSAEYERDSKRPRVESQEDGTTLTLDPLCPTPAIFPGTSPYLDRARTRLRVMDEQNVGAEERSMTDERWRDKGQELAARAGELVNKVVELMVNKNARAEKHRNDMLTVKAALAREQVELNKSREGLLKWVNPVLTLSRGKGKKRQESPGIESAASAVDYGGVAMQADSQNA
ncbi:BQ2448_3978 [Microbotryum intermedium]|uniref:BQ2448_3978 protein n=1 Tax=Microbotryum intermedium TaxID=269621 RepID=A0A238FJV9_9BASI|nr:BQ2448_3978 [Microbotryum intermedium]